MYLGHDIFSREGFCAGRRVPTEGIADIPRYLTCHLSESNDLGAPSVHPINTLLPSCNGERLVQLFEVLLVRRGSDRGHPSE